MYLFTINFLFYIFIIEKNHCFNKFFLVILFTGGCNKTNSNSLKSNKTEYANLAFVLDFYESKVDLNVKVAVWDNYEYRVTDQDLLFDKCKDLDVLMVDKNGWILIIFQVLIKKHLKKTGLNL